MIDVKIKLLHPESKMPVKANATDAGFDCYAYSKTLIEESGSLKIKYSLGFSMEIPLGWCALIFPRSSVCKTSLMLANSVGVIDSGYRGEVSAIFKSNTIWDVANTYEVGERICQIIFYKLPEVNLLQSDNLDAENDRNGGFGSTGK
jgi:dUTP pyrophosphatase